MVSAPAWDSSNVISRSKRRSDPRAASRAAEAEEVAEDVGEIGEAFGTRPLRRAGDAGMAEVIVPGALVRVAEHAVGFGGFLERGFRRMVAGIAIGMMFERELAIGALEIRVARVAVDTEDLVVVAPAHALATLTVAGRMSRSRSL